MDIKAKNLTPEIRQNILVQVEKQLAFTEYNRLIAKVGEDGLIDFVLAQTVANNTSAASTNHPTGSRVSYKVVVVIYSITALLGFTAGAYFPDRKNLFSLYEKLFHLRRAIQPRGNWQSYYMRSAVESAK